KWDGYRLEAVLDGENVRTFTRRGNDGSRYFPHLLSPPTWIAAETAVVDGEVVALDPDGAPVFELLQRKISGDVDVASVSRGYMGGEGSAKNLGALLVGTYEGAELRYGGRVGSGLNNRTRAMLKKRLDELSRPTPPFDPPPPREPALRHAHYAEPEIVVRAEFADWTREGWIRQSAFKGILEGRDPKTVVRERAIEPPNGETTAGPKATPAETAENDPMPPASTGRKASKAATPQKASAPSKSTQGAPATDGRAWAATEDELAVLERLGKEG